MVVIYIATLTCGVKPSYQSQEAQGASLQEGQKQKASPSVADLRARRRYRLNLAAPGCIDLGHGVDTG